LTAKLGTYLLAIAKNKWMAELRKRKRVSPQEVSEQISNGNPSSLDELLSEEKIAYVRKALDLLQPVCRKLLLLYYFEEKSMKEIAKILNLANTVISDPQHCIKRFADQQVSTPTTQRQNQYSPQLSASHRFFRQPAFRSWIFLEKSRL